MGVKSQAGGLRRSTGMHHQQEHNLGRCKQHEHNTTQPNTAQHMHKHSVDNNDSCQDYSRLITSSKKKKKQKQKENTQKIQSKRN